MVIMIAMAHMVIMTYPYLQLALGVQVVFESLHAATFRLLMHKNGEHWL